MQSKRSGGARQAQSPSPVERLAAEASFFRAWIENPGLTGAISPSSRSLARMMARYVDPQEHGPIIELGPGTGPVTQALLKRGVSPSRLVLVEYDVGFCRLLKRRFPRCRVIQGDAYDLRTTLRDIAGEPAAAVVSSLPLLNKPEHTRLKLLDDAFSLMSPNGRLIQFTYGINSPIPRQDCATGPVPFQAVSSAPVWLNIPPARVWVYQREGVRSAIAKDEDSLIERLKERTERMRDGWRERADRIEFAWRQRTAHAQRKLEMTKQRMRNEHGSALALDALRKIGEPKRPRR